MYSLAAKSRYTNWRIEMTFLVSHYNFGTTYSFDTLADAKAFCYRACFDAVVYHNGERIAKFSPISGWRQG